MSQEISKSVSLLAELAGSGGCMIEHKDSPGRSGLDIYIPADQETLERITHALSQSEAQWDNFLLSKIHGLGEHSMAIVPYQHLWAVAKVADEYISYDDDDPFYPFQAFESISIYLSAMFDSTKCKTDPSLASDFIHKFCTECCETYHQWKKTKKMTSEQERTVWRFTVSIDPTKEQREIGFNRYIKTANIKLPSTLDDLLDTLCTYLDECEEYRGKRARKSRSGKCETREVTVREQFDSISKNWLEKVESARNHRKTTARKSRCRKKVDERSPRLLHDYLTDLLQQRRPNHSRECINSLLEQVENGFKDSSCVELARLSPCYSAKIRICAKGKLPIGQSFRILLVSTASNDVLDMLPDFATISDTSKFMGGFLYNSSVGSVVEVDKYQKLYKSLHSGRSTLPKWWSSFFKSGESRNLAYIEGKLKTTSSESPHHSNKLSEWVRKNRNIHGEEASHEDLNNNLAIVFAK
jgi:hypothetical protein